MPFRRCGIRRRLVSPNRGGVPPSPRLRRRSRALGKPRDHIPRPFQSPTGPNVTRTRPFPWRSTFLMDAARSGAMNPSPASPRRQAARQPRVRSSTSRTASFRGAISTRSPISTGVPRFSSGPTSAISLRFRTTHPRLSNGVIALPRLCTQIPDPVLPRSRSTGFG